MRLIFQYIEGMILPCLLGILLYVIFRMTFTRKRKFDPKRDVAAGLFIAYCFGLASQTIFPRIDFGINSATGRPYFDAYFTNGNASVNFIPFKSILEQLSGENPVVGEADIWSLSLLNLLANILLFTPLGFFIPLLYKKFNNIGRMLCTGIAISALIEVIQLFIGRSSDVDDVILNTFGIMLGYGVFCLWKRIRNHD